MFLTRQLLSKKSKHLLVRLESMVSGHKRHIVRERAGDKLELIMHDPYVQQKVVYKEIKKIHGVN